MASRRRPRTASDAQLSSAAAPEAAAPEVGAREPCPCGSGRRYKACHGKRGGAVEGPTRPFQGLKGEADWIALREIVPAATAPLSLAGEHADRTVTLATILPLAQPAMVRDDGEVLLGLQGGPTVADPSRALAATLLAALRAKPGTTPDIEGRTDAARLQDLLADQPLDVTVHDGFEFWLRPDDERNPEVAASLERAQEHVVPTARLNGVDAAYWCRLAERGHLRWVLGGAGLDGEEDMLLDGLARLAAADGLTLSGPRFGDGAGSNRFVGSFRTHGRLVPVWDVDLATTADDCEQPLAELRMRLVAAVADGAPLNSAQRRARQGLRGRQLTLR